MDWRTQAERLHKMLVEELGQPVRSERGMDGAEWFEAGNPPEVVIRLDQTTASVYRYEAGWDGPERPFVRPAILATVHWREIGVTRTWMLCHTLIEEARAQRRATFRKCRYCKKSFGPEHMHSADACQGCAEKHLGVVY